MGIDRKINLINIIYAITITVIIITGIYIRTDLYLDSTPFWNDEYLLALNFINKNITDMFLPFELLQKIPPLFSSLVLLTLKAANGSVNPFLIFRFVPFISGILSVFLFWSYIRNIYKSKLTVIIGLILFTLNIQLIYYSQEFKPYSTDVFVCLLLLIFSRYINFKTISKKQIIIYSVFSFLSVLLSFASIFIIPAIIFAKYIQEKKFSYKPLIILFSVILACLYLYFSDLNTYKEMVNFWTDWGNSFFNLNNFYSVLEIFKVWLDFLQCMLLFNKYIYDYTVFGTFLIGLLILIIKRSYIGFLFLFLFINITLASVFKIYPFFNRGLIFLIPLIITIYISVFYYSLSYIMNSKNIVKKIFGVILLFIFIISMISMTKYIEPNEIIKNNKKIFKLNITESRDSRKEYYKIIEYIINNYKEDEKMIYTTSIVPRINFQNLINKTPKVLDNYDLVVFKKTDDINQIIQDITYKCYENKQGFWIVIKKSDIGKNKINYDMKNQLTYKDLKIESNGYNEILFYHGSF